MSKWIKHFNRNKMKRAKQKFSKQSKSKAFNNLLTTMYRTVYMKNN